MNQRKKFIILINIFLNKLIIEFTIEVKLIRNIEYDFIVVVTTPKYDHYIDVIYDINVLKQK